MVKRIKRGMAARQLFITEKDFDESLKDAIRDSENLAASGSNFAVVRRDFVFKNLELDAKTKAACVSFESTEGVIYEILRWDWTHLNVDRYRLLRGSGLYGEDGYLINQVPKFKIPDHRCLSPPPRFSGID